MVCLKNEEDDVNRNTNNDNPSTGDMLELTFKCEIDVILLIVSTVSALLNCLLLSKPDYYVLNEEHYIGVLKSYVSSKFFLDANPPGLSLLLSSLTLLLGLTNDLTNESLHRSALVLFYSRLISAVAGSAIPPLTYIILRKFNASTVASICGAILVLSNSVLLTDSRFVSANSIMTASSLLALNLLCNTGSELYASVKTYVVIAFCLGTSMTMLHLGFNTYIFVTGFVVYQEFQKFGDLAKSEKELWKRYISVVGIIFGVPLILYFLSYWHIVTSCTKSGATDRYLSASFQADLDGNLYHNIKNSDKTWIVNNSNVMLFTEDPNPCYLHSHPFDYLLNNVEEPFQQVTCYSAVDGNNWFKLETPTSEEGASQVIRHNDVVRLKHSLTGKYLTLFDGVESVSNELANLVAGREDNSGECWWVVEIVDEVLYSGYMWAANFSHVRLRSNITGHYLVQTGARLPEWGFEQLDVGGARSAAAVWTVRQAEVANSHQVEELRSTQYSTLSKILEIHKILFVTGQYSRVREHVYDTSPYTWLKPGLSMLYSYTNKEIIQARANTLLEEGMLVCLFSQVTLFVLLLIRRARGFADVTEEIWGQFSERNAVLLLGFIFHYCTFFFMQRPLFIFQFQFTYTLLVMSCVSFVDLLLRHFTRQLWFTLPVFTAYTAMVFVRCLCNFHFSVGYPADETEFYLLVD